MNTRIAGKIHLFTLFLKSQMDRSSLTRKISSPSLVCSFLSQSHNNKSASETNMSLIVIDKIIMSSNDFSKNIDFYKCGSLSLRKHNVSNKSARGASTMERIPRARLISHRLTVIFSQNRPNNRNQPRAQQISISHQNQPSIVDV